VADQPADGARPRRDRAHALLTRGLRDAVGAVGLPHDPRSSLPVPRTRSSGDTMSVNLRSLIGKLNPATRGCVEAGAGLCLARTHYDVEIEHFLTKALDSTDGDLAQILKHFGVNRSRLADDLARGLDRLKSGNARTPSLSPTLVKMLTEAWTLGSIDLGAPQVRIGHCVLALVATSELARLALDISKEFEKIPAEVLRKEFAPSPRRRPRRRRRSGWRAPAAPARRPRVARRARRRAAARRPTSTSSPST
jgi:ATP-dependent Clp protease ATP-binding subunit ClpA